MILVKMIKNIRRYIYTSIVKHMVGQYSEPLYVNGFSRVTKKTTLGKNVSLNGMTIQGCGEVSIGDNFHSGIGCLMITQNHNYLGEMLPYDDTYICKDIVIENNVWFGHKVVVLPGITICEGAIIQAGAVVSGDIPSLGIAGGNPAKVFRYRDKLHYNKLKKEKKFC